MVALTIFLAKNLPVRINKTASMPQGIYLVTGSHAIHIGDFVVVCLDGSLAQFALMRGYLVAGHCRNGIQPLLKQVVADGGNVVQLGADAVIVNGNSLSHSATLNRDSSNRALPAIQRGLYILKANQLWLYGTESAKSWDSRYFGAVSCEQIVQIVKPLLIWSGRSNT